MPQIALYLDEETAQLVAEAARCAGLSRSAWVREAIRPRLRRTFPESFFALFGSWEDDRTTEEILRDIRAGPEQRERPPLTCSV